MGPVLEDFGFFPGVDPLLGDLEIFQHFLVCVGPVLEDFEFK